MIWYFLVIAFFAINSLLMILAEDSDHDMLPVIPGAIAGLLLVILIIFIPVTIIANTNTDAKLSEINAERDAIVYQLKNKTYLNDNNLGAHEVFKDVANFNKKVVGNQKRKTSPWTSWLYSPIWLEVESIDLEDFGENN